MFRFRGLLQPVRTQEAGAPAPEARLTFSITGDYPDKVFGTAASGMAAVGRRGAQPVYSLLAMGLGGEELSLMDGIKGKAIEELLRAAGANRGRPTLAEAREAVLRVFPQGSEENRRIISYMVAHDIAGYGPISMLMEDQGNIEEIVVNSPESRIAIYHSKYGYCETNMRFTGEKSFRFTINKLISDTEKELSLGSPIIDAELPNGSRLHAQMRPYSLSGAAASIRLGGGRSVDVRKLMKGNAASPETLAYLWMAVQENMNVVVTGAPASGKTSLLLALNAFIPRYQRVVTIEEDVNELKFYSNFSNVVPLQGSGRGGSVSTQSQVINALHLRPDRLMVGEVRGGETNEIFSGANLGVPFMTTMHSSANGQAVINKLTAKPMAVQEQSIGMLDLSVFMRQVGVSERKIESIMEYSWLSRAEIGPVGADPFGGGLLIREIAPQGRMDSAAVKASKVVAAYARAHLVSKAAALKELRERSAFLSAMLQVKNEGIPVYKYMEKYLEM